MFDALNDERTDYTSPHRYQVILEATFVQEGKDGENNRTPVHGRRA